MTGKDLIIYILQNDLVDKELFTEGRIPGFMTREEAAVKANVGLSTIDAWTRMKMIDYIFVVGGYYIPADFKNPMEGSTPICTDSTISYQ